MTAIERIISIKEEIESLELTIDHAMVDGKIDKQTWGDTGKYLKCVHVSLGRLIPVLKMIDEKS